jgi:hypothetical protein
MEAPRGGSVMNIDGLVLVSVGHYLAEAIRPPRLAEKG